MSLRVKEYECVLLRDQISDAASSFVKYLLFLRSTGKYDYSNLERKFHVATIGYEEICCDFIDIDYVRCSSAELDRDLTERINRFREELRNSADVGGERHGKLTVEFYERRPNKDAWIQSCVDVPWERYVMKFTVKSSYTHLERTKLREQSAVSIKKSLIQMSKDVVSATYRPRFKIPEAEIEQAYCTDYSDVQPYLFRIMHQTGHEKRAESLIGTLRRFLSVFIGV